MVKTAKPVAILAVLMCFACSGLLQACHGEEMEAMVAGIEPRDVIGRIEPPGLKNDGKSGAGPLYQNVSYQQSPKSDSAVKSLPEAIRTDLPDFSGYTNVAEKKRAFFDFLRPIVRKENRKVLQERAYVLLKWQRVRDGSALSAQEIRTLTALADKYRVDSAYEEAVGFFREMLIHIDKIPVSLALIQAAKESGWGTSYFARQGNNLFGQWCFEAGCGIVPRKRPAGASYEVRAFDDVAESVCAYIRNLNSHPAYRELRIQRYRMRIAGKEPDPHLLANGLEKYSEIGMRYVETVRRMIRGNEKFMGLHEPTAGS